MTAFYQNGTVATHVENNVTLPSSLTGPSYNFPNEFNNEPKGGIYLQTSTNKITTIGTYNQEGNFDSFFIIPTVDLCLDRYTYLAASIRNFVGADGSVVVVGTANQTIMNITVPVSAFIKINNSENWLELDPGVLYSYEIQRLQIVYIAAFTTDLTATKITTNKPISLFSGHECAFIPRRTLSCSMLMEQIPPTNLWGTVHYFAPLASRRSYTIKVIAAFDSTAVHIYCDETRTDYTINTTAPIIRVFNNQEYCGVYANQSVLVVQFSHSNGTDLQGNQMMTLIPATVHYTNSITSSTFQSSREDSNPTHYLNIIVLPSYYQPEMISLTTAGGVSQSLDSQQWIPIIRDNVTDAYAAQVEIQHGVFELSHANKVAMMTAVIYGFETGTLFGGYGHPGWLMEQFNGMCM